MLHFFRKSIVKLVVDVTSTERKADLKKKEIPSFVQRAGPTRSSLDDRTKALAKKMKLAVSSATKLLRTEDLAKHLLEYPETRELAIKGGAIQTLLKFERGSSDEALRGRARECLALLGYATPPRRNGICLLSIDGGGTRGMMALEILEALEKECGKRIHQLFDCVVGVSTGAILGSLLAGFKLTVAQSRQIYKPVLEPYIFRNFNHMPGSESLFPGDAKYKIWQALQATAAAPGYFQEVKLDHWLHQDGGLMVNNPTAVGLHECKLLWPNSPIQCILSIGNGRSVLSVSSQLTDSVPEISSLKEKMFKIVDSATDTEMVHITLNDLLKSGTYFRLNPYMTHCYALDEIDPKKLNQMKEDAQLYLRKNRRKLKATAIALLKKRSLWQKFKDCISYHLILKFNYISHFR